MAVGVAQMQRYKVWLKMLQCCNQFNNLIRLFCFQLEVPKSHIIHNRLVTRDINEKNDQGRP